ncbi:hypothetical protein SAY86_015178 [Trapa natans]|uniref:Uncharacterized protein n=1 Tax=Trapa natans TaxID=22666 RepID=A0AAN7KEA8_TRANT|nr:hypothetical protein SAY86_015178 [Trapa natans]
MESHVKTVLPLDEDPPAITSLCFNHNGKILAASATDAMIHMFDLMMMRRLAGLLRYGMALDASLHSDTETGQWDDNSSPYCIYNNCRLASNTACPS